MSECQSGSECSDGCAAQPAGLKRNFILRPNCSPPPHTAAMMTFLFLTKCCYFSLSVPHNHCRTKDNHRKKYVAILHCRILC